MLVLAFLFSLFGSSLGEEVEYCYEAPLNDSPGWSHDIVAQMYDPSLGDLVGAQITINFTIVRDVQASNQGNSSANVTFNGSGNLSLVLPDKSVFRMESLIDLADMLATKNELNSNKSISKIQNLSLDKSQLKMFTASHPNETITMPLEVSSQISFTSDGPLTSEVDLKSRAAVCIEYDYSAALNKNEGVVDI